MTVNEKDIIPEQNQSIQCPVCGDPIAFQITKSKKSGKPSLMMKCPRDGRHFRAFICDKKFVEDVLVKLQTKESSNQNSGLPLIAKPLQN